MNIELTPDNDNSSSNFSAIEIEQQLKLMDLEIEESSTIADISLSTTPDDYHPQFEVVNKTDINTQVNIPQTTTDVIISASNTMKNNVLTVASATKELLDAFFIKKEAQNNPQKPTNIETNTETNNNIISNTFSHLTSYLMNTHQPQQQTNISNEQTNISNEELQEIYHNIMQTSPIKPQINHDPPINENTEGLAIISKAVIKTIAQKMEDVEVFPTEIQHINDEYLYYYQNTSNDILFNRKSKIFYFSIIDCLSDEEEEECKQKIQPIFIVSKLIFPSLTTVGVEKEMIIEKEIIEVEKEMKIEKYARMKTLPMKKKIMKNISKTISNKKKTVNTNTNRPSVSPPNNWSSMTLGSMLTHTKYKLYSMIATPNKYKWNPFILNRRYNRHTFHDQHHTIYLINGTSYNTPYQIQDIILDIYSKIWITYRKNFKPILSSNYTSDAGWGCMLRTTQMMTAQALIVLFFDHQWRITHLDENTYETYFKILDYFTENNSLSIHNMMYYGWQMYSKPVGHWFGPLQTCFMISKCITSDEVLSEMIGVVICPTDSSGVIYKSDVFEQCFESFDEEKDGILIENENENENENCANCSNCKMIKSALIFIPIRLGLDHMNKEYIPAILECFSIPQCIGIIGGKPQRSLYFIGCQNQRLFYLDPHTVFECLDSDVFIGEQKCVFHCQNVNSLVITDLDPSMAIGFFIKDEKEFEEFWEYAEMEMGKEYSVFSVADERPVYDDNWLMRENDGEIDSGNDESDEWEKI